MEPKTKFYRKVDTRSRQAMIDFLSSHFRYNTMNSWNQSSAYANCVKLYKVIPDKLQDQAYKLMDTDDFYAFHINDILTDWDYDQDHIFQAGFNGRSGGYIVMYHGGRKPTDHKSRCQNCLQLNFKTVEETGNATCGRCGQDTRVNLASPVMQKFTYPGKSIDQGETFEDWDMSELKERVKLVQSFDEMCDSVVAATIHMCETMEVKEEEYVVTKTRNVLVDKEEA